MKTFKSLVYELDKTGKVSPVVKEHTLENLHDGKVIIRVAYSSVNYKDALAATNNKSGIIRHYPLIGGIDLSGEVLSSTDNRLQKGDHVVVTGYGLGVSHHGGYSHIARVPTDWVIKLPDTLSLKEGMILGTAGLTAALSINALLKHGLEKNKQAQVLITGASGGVGSLASSMLKKLGYENLTALSRKKTAAKDFFDRLCINSLTPEEIAPEKIRPLMTQRFDFVLDTVGGKQLEKILPQVSYNGSVSMCGNAGGTSFEASVLPFILRGINLLGIDSVQITNEERADLWQQMGNELKPENLEMFIQDTVSLAELPEVFSHLIEGRMTGRYLVKL